MKYIKLKKIRLISDNIFNLIKVWCADTRFNLAEISFVDFCC